MTTRNADGPQLGEIADAVARIAPAELSALRASYPEAALMLQPGAVMGDEPTHVPPACGLALALLARYGASSAGLLERMRRRLGASWWFDLIAKLAATGGAAGTIAAFLSKLPSTGIAGGPIALVGSACGLVFSLMQRDAAGNSLIASYNRLVEALVEADEQNRALSVLCPAGPSAELDQALEKVNQLARVLNELDLRYGRRT